MLSLPPRSALFPYPTLFRSATPSRVDRATAAPHSSEEAKGTAWLRSRARLPYLDRKSTRLNSSHPSISYAVFCLKKKNEDDLVGAERTRRRRGRGRVAAQQS